MLLKTFQVLDVIFGKECTKYYANIEAYETWNCKIQILKDPQGYILFMRLTRCAYLGLKGCRCCSWASVSTVVNTGPLYQTWAQFDNETMPDELVGNTVAVSPWPASLMPTDTSLAPNFQPPWDDIWPDPLFIHSTAALSAHNFDNSKVI